MKDELAKLAQNAELDQMASAFESLAKAVASYYTGLIHAGIKPSLAAELTLELNHQYWSKAFPQQSIKP